MDNDMSDELLIVQLLDTLSIVVSPHTLSSLFVFVPKKKTTFIPDLSSMLSYQQFSIIYVKDLLLAGHRSRKVETENIFKNMIMIYLSTLNRPQSSDSVCNTLISYDVFLTGATEQHNFMMDVKE
uniref:Uncharacterized protein n=1 Tax=Glossina pallidipes TaxID=7398 RepID=A0A1A9Z9Y1_GLOPL